MTRRGGGAGISAATCAPDDPPAHGRSRLHRGRRADAGRRRAPARLRAAGRRQHSGRQAHEARRHRRLRIHRLPRRHRGSLHSRSSRSDSGMHWKTDFHVGYSPERINPGDKEHTLTKILKVVSGDTPRRSSRSPQLYESDRHGRRPPRRQHQGRRGRQGHREHPARPQHRADERAGDHLRPARHRHAATCSQAAGTKWNFLPFQPGLVGGHCIGVDPYYLTHKAEQLGYHPQVILAGRRINDGMGDFIAEQTVKQMIARGQPRQGRARSTCSA